MKKTRPYRPQTNGGYEEGRHVAAPTAISATVSAVEGPFWNQSDGQKWIDSGADSMAVGADYTVPALYREVTLAIDEVTKDDLGLVSDKSELEIVALGGAARSRTLTRTLQVATRSESD